MLDGSRLLGRRAAHNGRVDVVQLVSRGGNRLTFFDGGRGESDRTKRCICYPTIAPSPR